MTLPYRPVGHPDHVAPPESLFRGGPFVNDLPASKEEDMPEHDVYNE
jgi:hypothetical protein